MRSVNLSLLRPALEAAVVVARVGEASDPPVAAPGPLRPYLRFARLPGPALDIARRVLDDDDDFRSRVAAATTEGDIGAAGWLWLTRPEGWEEKLDELRKSVTEHALNQREERAERDARRRLGRAEDIARRAEASLARSEKELNELKVDLHQAKADRQAFEAEFGRLNELVARLTEERTAAIRRMKEAENGLAQRSGELRHARHQLRMVQAELDQVLGTDGAARRRPRRSAMAAEQAGPGDQVEPRGQAVHPGPSGAATAPASAEPAFLAPTGAPGEPPAPPPASRESEPPDAAAALVDQVGSWPAEAGSSVADPATVEQVVAHSIAAASAAAQQLSAALAAAARALGPSAFAELVRQHDQSSPASDAPARAQRPGTRPVRRLGGPPGAGSPADRGAVGGAGSDPAGPRRHPVNLPPGLRDDSVQAADFLVRVQGMVVLVDGYNVTHAAWPDETIVEQRNRLVDALNELHARTGAGIEVVFDGDDAEPPAAPAPGGRAAIRVRFSPPGVEADDIVLALVDAYPTKLPVVVASSDRRVIDGARRRGANVVSARQLLAALNR